jgi:transcriptional regulator with XRE-family HTH domain
MGYVLSWILIYVLNKQSFGWTIAFHTPVRLIAAIAGGDVHRVAAGGTRSIASSATDRSRECDEGGTSTSRWSRNPLCRVGLLVEPLVAPLPFFCRKPGVVSNRHARYLSRWRVIPMQISGKRVREWRELQGWTQSQMGAFAELDVRTVQRVESHGRGSLETLKALAATLGVDISQFSALEASDHPGQTKDTQNNLLGTYGPLLASLTDALKATHHWRQHFNDLFIFRNSFFRDPDPPLFQTVEQHAHLAATVSLQLHQDIAEGIRQLKALNHEVRSFGGHIRGLSRVGYHVAPEVQQEGAAVGNRLCDHVEFYLGRARKELVARVYPHQAA